MNARSGRENSLRGRTVTMAEYIIKVGEEGYEKPTVIQELVRCKDCKYWKDSDGVYRRGFNAESKCPLNLKKVYEGIFYCGMAERKNDE